MGHHSICVDHIPPTAALIHLSRLPPLGNLSILPYISQLEEESVHNYPTLGYRIDHVLRAMLEEFDQGDELLRKMEGGKELHINLGIIIEMCQYAT